MKAFEVKWIEDVNIDWKNIFENIKPQEVDRLNQVFNESCENYNKDCIHLGKTMAEKMGCQNTTEYCAATEYAVRQMDADVKKLRNDLPNPREYRRRIITSIKSLGSTWKVRMQEFEKLTRSFRKLITGCGLHSDSGQLRFGNPMVAANHYDKHSKD